jgi:hypothetical protein
MYLKQKIIGFAKIYAAYFAMLKADILQAGITQIGKEQVAGIKQAINKGNAQKRGIRKIAADEFAVFVGSAGELVGGYFSKSLVFVE